MVVPSRTSGRPRSRTFSGRYEVGDEASLTPSELELAERHIARADQELSESRVNIRWGTEQLEVIREAARLAGVPYQSYVKEAAMRRAMEDLRTAREAGIADRVLRPGRTG